jgi:hypothetical protein
MSDTCSKAMKNDMLWRRAMLVLSLYGERLETVASGGEVDTSGKIQAAMSGISGADWSDADDQASRDAVTNLVSQMGATPEGKADLGKIVQDAAPSVRVLCDSLGSTLDKQAQDLATLQKDWDKKRMSRTARRCGMLEKQTVCVGDSVVDRMVYAGVYGQVVALESSTLEARDGVARFCAAHDKLVLAAGNGSLAKKQTYFDVADAVRAVPRAQPQWAGSSAGSEAPKPADNAKPAPAAAAPAAVAEPPKK